MVKGEEHAVSANEHGWWSGGQVPALGRWPGFQLQLRIHCVNLGKSLCPIFLICKTEMLTGLCVRMEWDSIPGVKFKI